MDERVLRVAEQIRARPAGRRLTIRKAHPGHTPHDLAYKRDCHPVEVDGLDRVIAIDRERATATVEGQVTLGQLCKATFAAGLMPKVVPEFETFTVAVGRVLLRPPRTSQRNSSVNSSCIARQARWAATAS